MYSSGFFLSPGMENLRFGRKYSFEKNAIELHRREVRSKILKYINILQLIYISVENLLCGCLSTQSKRAFCGRLKISF